MSIFLKKTRQKEAKELYRSGIHEAGHLLYAREMGLQEAYSRVTKKKAYTHCSPPSFLETYEAFEMRVAYFFAGRIAEQLIYGWNNISLGSIQDVAEAKKYAEYIVTHVGYRGHVYAHIDRTARNAINEMLHAAEERAMNYLSKHKSILRAIAEELMAGKKVYAKDIDQLEREYL